MDFFGNTTPGSQMPMQNETYQPTENAAVQEEKKAPQRNPFAIWEVGGETYRLKLQTAGVKELEAKYKGSIMELMSFKGGMPPLTVMLDVAHTAMKPWTHKVSAKDMESLYDKYEQEGGDLLSFFTNVYLDVFLVSGFLSKPGGAEMSESLAEMQQRTVSELLDELYPKFLDMGYSPSFFWECSLAEVVDLFDSYRRREDRRQKRKDEAFKVRL